jgi:aminopeptidase 2
MCKMHGHRGGEAETGAVDIAMGREILPANVIPKHYDLTFEPDFKKLTFKGTVTIDLDVVEDSTSISLNTLEIDIHNTKVLSGEQTIRSVMSRQLGPHYRSFEPANTLQLVSGNLVQ